MINFDEFKQNPSAFASRVAQKGYIIDTDALITLDEARRELIGEIETLRKEANAIADKGAAITDDDKQHGKKLKEKIKVQEKELESIEFQLSARLSEIPNPPFDDVPEGAGETDNKVLREWGEVRQVTFTPKDHLALAEAHQLVNFEAGAKVSGSQFYYLKNEGALLELALVSYALNILQKRGFTILFTPDLARSEFYSGTGYLPKGKEAQTYEVAGEDLGLIATSEVTLAAYHSNEILEGDDLPRRYAGFSHCFRREAGAYGKYSKGLYRVHQFSKVEMFCFCAPTDSPAIHSEFLSIEEELFQGLGLPYRVVEMCARDLGAQAAKKYDLEVWMPGRGEWGEVTSTSNTTDYQSRNLNIKYRDSTGETHYTHTLNGTAIASSRAIIAILENYQRDDEGIDMPKALQPYLSFTSIEPKSR
jgi:seryl-tRNA synthetase